MEAGMSELIVKGVSRIFPGVHGGKPVTALQPTDLDIAKNDFVTILGPSGCGKSTLLRIIAGLDKPTTGTVTLEGSAITGPGADRGMVFQSYTLFPWLSIRENVAFGLRERGIGAKEKWEIVDSYIDKVGLRGFENHWPKQLSGGMQQRTAIARAFIHDPKLILMDEPFGALDALTREQMNLEMLRIWRESGKTILFVTHSIQEAVFLASHCAVLTAGPARMAEYFPIELPFPRDLPIKTTDEFGAYARRIYALLGLSPNS
jgi:NitT/TauT family transport system ATP-binding protein